MSCHHRAVPRRKETSDSEILEAARSVFLEEGFAASTKTIARVAGVSEGVLFQRYGSKKDLFFHAMSVPRPDLGEALEESRNTARAMRALEIVTLASLDYLRSIMPIILLVLTHPARQDFFHREPDAAHKLLEAFGLDTTLQEIFRERVANGELPERDYGTLTTILIASLLTRILHEQIGLTEPTGMSTGTWVRKTLEVLID